MTNQNLQLEQRLETLLGEERARREERGRAVAAEMVVREAEMGRADALAERWIDGIILPRLTALAAVFPNSAKPGRAAGERRATLHFSHCEDFPVDARVDVTIDPRSAPGRIRVAFDASIIPILMDYSRGGALELAGEEPDDARLAGFLDDSIVRFAADYLRVRAPDSVYQRGLLVTDPVCGMAFRRAEAAATSDYDGQTWHFCALECRDRFAADPERYARKRPVTR